MLDGEPRKRIPLNTALTALAVALGAAALAVALTRGGSEDTAVLPADDEPAPVEAAQPIGGGDAAESVYRTAAAGVVEIGAGGATGMFRGGRDALGTGFVIDDEGHIVTNDHVVSRVSGLTVSFADGSEVTAEVVATDPSTDIAVLDVDRPASDLSPLELGSSADLSVGQDVYAIGNPYGLERTLTAGIVSALDRRIRAPNGYTISGAIQTDAPINSGNSGGPLLDEHGRVVGVTAQIESRTGGNVGIGYAVPIDLVKKVVEQLLASGSVEHAYLGVAVEPARGSSRGASITEVRPGSPADEAGLRAGDRIVSADGEPIDSPEEISAIVGSRQPGDRLELEVERGGETTTVTVTLGTRPT